MNCFTSFIVVVIVLVEVITCSNLCPYSCAAKTSANISSNDCNCYSTKYCLNEFWKHSSTSALDRAAIDVAFFPFLKADFASGYPPLPALNITFTINNNDIKALTFRLHENCMNPNATAKCRYYNFTSTKVSLMKAVFYNDEFFFINSVENPCSIEVTGLNSQLETIFYSKFLLKILDSRWFAQTGSKINISKWQSQVTIDLTSYNEQSVRIMFTTPPQQFNVSFYKLRLVENGVPKAWEILETLPRPIVYKLLSGIETNKEYLVQITIDDHENSTCGAECYISSSSKFSFYEEESGFGVLHVLWVLIVVLFVVTIAGLIWIIRRKRSIRFNGAKVKLFIVYSHDIKEHDEVIKCLAEYLQTYCHCDVMLDIWHIKNKDPYLWVSKCIASADYILIIWSRGAKIKVTNDNTKMLKNEPGYLGDLFSTAMTIISSNISKQLSGPLSRRNLHKFVNISLSYVPSDAVPPQLDYLPFFCLPFDFNTMLCHIHGLGPSQLPSTLLPSPKSVVYGCCRCYPSLPISNLEKLPEGKAFVEALKNMQKLEIQGNWFDKQLVDDPLLNSGSQNVVWDNSDVEDSDSKSYLNATTESESIINGSQLSLNEPELETAFPPNIHDLPIFGPNNLEAPYPFWPPPRQLTNDDSFSDNQMKNSEFNPVDYTLIDNEVRIPLPLNIFGPNTCH